MSAEHLSLLPLQSPFPTSSALPCAARAASRELTCAGCTNDSWTFWLPGGFGGNPEGRRRVKPAGMPLALPSILGSLGPPRKAMAPDGQPFPQRTSPACPPCPHPCRPGGRWCLKVPLVLAPSLTTILSKESLHQAFSVSPLQSVVCFLPRPQPLHSATTTFFLFLSSSLL